MADPIVVDAEPTKQFFVRMLTRDIELLDSILDLLDNCIDGIIRTQSAQQNASSKPISGFFAKITATADKFVIEDNCGGIPKKYRPRKWLSDSADRRTKIGAGRSQGCQEGTVGLYGIGMKRAIFKMGRQATITTEHGSEAFRESKSVRNGWTRVAGNLKWYRSPSPAKQELELK